MKLFKKLFVNILAVSMMLATCLGLVGCSDDKVQVEFTLAIYNQAESEYYEDTTLTVTMHRDFAPETVKAILSYVEEGYYNDAIFYGVDSNKIMVGDLKMSADGKVYQNQTKPTVKPEMENGGAVAGTGLKVKEGSIALWRTWNERDGYETSTSLDTGRATMLMPTSDMTAYDGWFCVFATIDLENETNKNTLANLKNAVLNFANTYEVYYTGEEYGADELENNGLTFNCEQEIPDDVEPFEPEGEQYECYRQYQIKIAKGAGTACGAKIVSAKIV